MNGPFGSRLEIDGPGDGAFAAAVVAALGDRWAFPVHRDGTRGGWRVAVAAVAGPAPSWVLAAPASPRSPAPRYVTAGPDEVWVVDDVSAVQVVVGPHGSEVRVHGTPSPPALALNAALVEALAGGGLLPLHAAAMTFGGRTVLLQGPSGRGKSTTLLRGVASGWAPVGEDVCWVEPGTLRICSGDTEVRFLPDAHAVFASTGSDAPAGPLVRGKHRVPLDRLHRTAAELRVTDLAVLVRDPRHPSAWRPLSRANAVMALYEARGIPSTQRVRERLPRLLGELVGQVSCWSLVLGSTPLPLGPDALPAADAARAARLG